MILNDLMHKRYADYSWLADKLVTMPRINDYVLNCVVYIYPSAEAARNAERVGGSGFIAGVRSKKYPHLGHPYFVTASHVINQITAEGGIPVLRVNRKDGGVDYMEAEQKHWTQHPTSDLAVLPVTVFTLKEYQIDFFLMEDMFLNKKRQKDFDIGVGDDIFIVGRFQAADGKEQNTPTLRFGNISRMPVEPVIFKSGLKLEAYLVECHSISAFSGCPVFVRIMPYVPRPDSEVLTTLSATLLLGIGVGHLRLPEVVKRKNDERDKWEEDPKLKVLANSAMMGVIPAWKLEELLYMDELKKQREEQDKKSKKEDLPSEEEALKPDSVTGITEEEFKKALKKVSKKVNLSEPDPEEPKT